MPDLSNRSHPVKGHVYVLEGLQDYLLDVSPERKTRLFVPGAEPFEISRTEAASMLKEFIETERPLQVFEYDGVKA